jgi:sulfotransferase
MEQMVCLSGLPRSGSTLLSAILSQNPLIHAEGNSAVCQFIWDIHQTGTVHAAEQLHGNNRTKTVGDMIQAVPHIYYKDVPATKKIIVDKCRSWTIPANVELLKKYIDPHIKIIVLERSVEAIIKSFMKLYVKNNWPTEKINATLKALLTPGAEPIMRSICGINLAKKNNTEQTFLFIQYDDLIAQPAETLQRIYTFCGWAPYAHDFQQVVNTHPENDAYYGLKDFHTIRATVGKEENTVVLPAHIGGLLPP